MQYFGGLKEYSDLYILHMQKYNTPSSDVRTMCIFPPVEMKHEENQRHFTVYTLTLRKVFRLIDFHRNC